MRQTFYVSTLAVLAIVGARRRRCRLRKAMPLTVTVTVQFTLP